jgi:very-short-patch-repair endonuclease
LGLGDRQIEHGLHSGRLHAIHRGVYAVGHKSLPIRGHWIAAVLAAGDGALLSHRSAAALLGLRGDSRARVDVTVAGQARRDHSGVDVHRARNLLPADRAIRDAIPVTALPRTLLDLGAVVNARQLERAFEAAERLRVLDMRALHELAVRSHGHHGLGAFRRLIERHHEIPETREELERRLIDLCDEYLLPRPACNVALEGFIVDALWSHARLVAEVDSWEFHRTRAAFERDRARDAALQLAGYTVVRITARRIQHDPGGVASTLRRLLERR